MNILEYYRVILFNKLVEIYMLYGINSTFIIIILLLYYYYYYYYFIILLLYLYIKYIKI